MGSARPIPSEFAKLFTCDPATGVITRLVDFGRFRAGSVVRVRPPNGHHTHAEILVARKEWLAHRVVWFLCLGEQPPPLIDHINGDPSDNRLGNLRAATKSQNAANSRRYSGRALPKGVCKTPRGTFRAYIMVDQKHIALGTHADQESAHAAYIAAAKRLFGDFARAV